MSNNNTPSKGEALAALEMVSLQLAGGTSVALNKVRAFISGAPDAANAGEPAVSMRPMEFDDGRKGWYIDHPEFYADIEPDPDSGRWTVFFREKATGREGYAERGAAADESTRAPDGRVLPHPGSPEASAMMDSMLAEYQWPANSKNAARAGWEAANRWLARECLAAAPVADERARLPKIIEVLAKWEDRNGTLAGILPHEWAELWEPIASAAVIESPRMARAALSGGSPEPVSGSEGEEEGGKA